MHMSGIGSSHFHTHLSKKDKLSKLSISLHFLAAPLNPFNSIWKKYFIFIKVEFLFYEVQNQGWRFCWCFGLISVLGIVSRYSGRVNFNWSKQNKDKLIPLYFFGPFYRHEPQPTTRKRTRFSISAALSYVQK